MVEIIILVLCLALYFTIMTEIAIIFLITASLYVHSRLLYQHIYYSGTSDVILQIGSTHRSRLGSPKSKGLRPGYMVGSKLVRSTLSLKLLIACSYSLNRLLQTGYIYIESS